VIVALIGLLFGLPYRLWQKALLFWSGHQSVAL